jgi:hypothetical protein
VADQYNLYEYVKSRPTVATDPTGAQILDFLLGSTMSMRLRAAQASVGAAALSSVRLLVDRINATGILLRGLLDRASKMDASRGWDYLERGLNILANRLPGRVQAFTARNFSREFSRLFYGSVDALKGTGQHVHHLFQKGGELGKWFVERGINPNLPFFGVELSPEKHAAIKGAWEAAWVVFKDKYPTATVTQILQEAQRLGDALDIRKWMLF